MSSSIAALTPATQPIPGGPPDRAAPEVPPVEFNELWQDKKEGLSFGDFLDIINPLQHIPVVSTIYRMVTGDEIGVASRLAGGALFGGPLGLIGAGVVAAFESVSGETVESQVASVWKDLTGEDDATQLAQAEAAAKTVAAVAPAAGPVADAVESEVAVEELAPPPEEIATAAPAMAVAAPRQSAAAHALPPSRIYIKSPSRDVPTAATTLPAEPAAKTAPAPEDAQAADERRRIAQSIEQARRAQAGLLLANIAADTAPAKPTDGRDKDGAEAITSQPQPFRPHPYMLPPGAPPDLINRAMAQALDRYEALMKQRGTGTTPAAPRPAPALVQ